MSLGQEVELALAVNLPVYLIETTQNLVDGSPIAIFLSSIVALFVFIALIGVPIAALVGKKYEFEKRSLTNIKDLSSRIETLSRSKAVEDFLNEPLDTFIDRIVNEGGSRSMMTLGDVALQAGRSLSPAISYLNFNDAFQVVQVPGEACQKKLICHAHSYVNELPTFLQQAYSFIGPQIQHHEEYSDAILEGLSGGDCNAIYEECSYTILQMAGLIPLLKTNKGQIHNEL